MLVKTILKSFHRYLLWLLISVFLWSWTFMLISDAPREKKVSVYYLAPDANDTEMAIELEKRIPEGIEIIDVYPFSHAAFTSGAPEQADIYIVSESDLDSVLYQLQPIPARGGDDYVKDGLVYGWRIYSMDTGEGRAKSFIRYSGEKGVPEGAKPDPEAPGSILYREDENYYLCFNKDSLHTGDWNGSKDSAALSVAENIFLLP